MVIKRGKPCTSANSDFIGRPAIGPVDAGESRPKVHRNIKYPPGGENITGAELGNKPSSCWIDLTGSHLSEIRSDACEQA